MVISLDKYRRTICYITCGRIGILATPVYLIILKLFQVAGDASLGLGWLILGPILLSITYLVYLVFIHCIIGMNITVSEKQYSDKKGKMVAAMGLGLSPLLPMIRPEMDIQTFLKNHNKNKPNIVADIGFAMYTSLVIMIPIKIIVFIIYFLFTAKR